MPLFGSIVYIITRVLNKKDIGVIQDEIHTIINPSKKIQDLEDKLQFSETHQNRINLADEYLNIGDYKNAITHYEKSLEGNFKEDFYTIKQLIKAYYKINDFKKAIEFSKKIKHKVDFNKSKAQFYYGLSLEKLEFYDEAEFELKKTDQPYSNYEARIVLSKLLISRNKIDDAKEILNEIITESQHMTRQDRKLNSQYIIEAENLIKGF